MLIMFVSCPYCSTKEIKHGLQYKKLFTRFTCVHNNISATYLPNKWTMKNTWRLSATHHTRSPHNFIPSISYPISRFYSAPPSTPTNTLVSELSHTPLKHSQFRHSLSRYMQTLLVHDQLYGVQTSICQCTQDSFQMDQSTHPIAVTDWGNDNSRFM